METSNLVNFIVSMYARRHGISEEEARRILEPILKDREKLDELATILREAEMIGDTYNRIPDEVKPIASKLLSTHFEEDDDLKSIIKEASKLAIQLKIIDYVLGSTVGTSRHQPIEDERIRRLIEENERLRQENEELKEKLERILNAFEEAKKRREIQELQNKLTELSNEINMLKSSIEAKLMQTRNPEEVRDELEMLNRSLRRYLEIKEMLDKLSGKEESSKIPQEILEKLKSLENVPSNNEGIKVWLDVLDKIVKLAQTVGSGKNFSETPQPAQETTTITVLPKPEETSPQQIEGGEEFVPIKSPTNEIKQKKFKPLIVGGGENAE